ncbi:hypothetical protein PIB30_055605 [Stylosanthes scabra]|uniref:Uncharacterized protein n=1 Tax=Stylosanthes scabra TaxID=79078 RepID=A0ABU6XHD1_9FABA|nr:hypothetical protein [Stylosanthes scabra]
MKEKNSQKNNFLEVTQVKSSAELVQLYKIKIEKNKAENDKKASLQAQGPKDPTRNQPITINEDALQEQHRHPKKKTKVLLVLQKPAEAEKNPQIGNRRDVEAEKGSHIGNRRAAKAEKNS